MDRQGVTSRYYLQGVVYLDFQEAFDKVPHQRLLILVVIRPVLSTLPLHMSC